MRLERRDDVSHGRRLLPDRTVDAGDITALLREDGVDRERGLAELPVADDELSLTASDRHERIDRLHPGVKRHVDRTPLDDSGGGPLGRHPCRGHDRSPSVYRTAQ